MTRMVNTGLIPRHVVCVLLVERAPFLYTADARIVKHMLKDQFNNYEKGGQFNSTFNDILG